MYSPRSNSFSKYSFATFLSFVPSFVLTFFFLSFFHFLPFLLSSFFFLLSFFVSSDEINTRKKNARSHDRPTDRPTDHFLFFFFLFFCFFLFTGSRWWFFCHDIRDRARTSCPRGLTRRILTECCGRFQTTHSADCCSPDIANFDERRQTFSSFH